VLSKCVIQLCYSSTHILMMDTACSRPFVKPARLYPLNQQVQLFALTSKALREYTCYAAAVCCAVALPAVRQV
jgi:hypothetical protein